ncbi:MAG: DNA-3-methyladenine glycosylase [Blastocatellia bacterium]|nr:DNA-3-methyladenine glycosylase [Blastocatellia bacterium]
MYQKALKHLKKVDPVMDRIITQCGPCTYNPDQAGTHYDMLVRAILFQQLSGKAATTIHNRLKERFGGRNPLPAEVMAAPDEDFRAVGVSRQKLTYLRDLAEKAHLGTVAIDTLHELEDPAIIGELVKIKGIGRWTAQIFMMFRLGRLDVLPELDLGIQKAIQLHYNLETLPKPKDVLEIGAKWSPYATIASWYLWRSLDGEAN